VPKSGRCKPTTNTWAEHKLAATKGDDPLRRLARAQTIAVLGRLDASAKGEVLAFLYGAKLIRSDHTVLSLLGSDLSLRFNQE
jgi:hypothetical protein